MLCFLGLSWSQEALISGFIINDNDQTPIHGANIYFKKLGIGTVSQVDGRFVLDDLPYGEISLTISMIGYKDKEKSIVLDKTSYDLGVIYMLRETIKIEEIIVDAHHELQPKSFSSNIYITGGQYHSNLKSSLALTLEEETGLSIRS
ncbi:MAG TPA: carboxypeptidase-like regulatory domain-containing protein, partial [Candidatus Marinimicrobia bacterium]|nr:carboxypeptidase-like regulatory domain-containing protein [Candidatus Neomarinimicrobiota bacterium]